MKLWHVRRELYGTARILGDVQAVERGPVAVAKRIERRRLWRLVGQFLRKVTAVTNDTFARWPAK
jgi:hypothetical protein